MARERKNIDMETFLVTILVLIPIAFSNDVTPIPADASQVQSWFNQHVQPLSARMGTVDPALANAEASVKVIRVAKDGTGNFNNIKAALSSIPQDNKNRIIIRIGPGTYKERIKVEWTKPFVTFYGDPNNMPLLVSEGNANTYGTMDSATLIVEADYFSAVNVMIQNTSPRPTGKPKQQALAMRIAADKASFYNCKFFGFQDTLCDNFGKHFYKDCYIEGTVDFIFGDGKSIYLNCEFHVIPGDQMAMIAAQSGGRKAEDEGFSMVHCKVTGTGGIAYLGRAWMRYPKVVYSYCHLSDVVQKEGWFNSRNNANNA
ncbi:hypothetical protein LIER_34174 [Lithospermum erythrorhizon]|uniref:Pectinesterase n=1 Tax=Lithospermum erythrorhizon TaxID=34254 RepID=A0AAV3S3A9_LITER